jgi:hypothetical protein
MPNHCRNVLSVVGVGALEFAKKAKGHYPDYAQDPNFDYPAVVTEDDNKPSELCFNQFIPVPQGLLERTFGAENYRKICQEDGVDVELVDDCESGYDWQCHNWGTKWGAYNEARAKVRDNELVEYNFTTAWGAPVNFIATVSTQYPEMTFVLSFGGEGPILGRIIMKNGAILDDISDMEGQIEHEPEYPENEEDEEAMSQYDEDSNEWLNQFIDTQDTCVAEYR